ncbi:hypothetical protein RJ43_12020 [Alteromonas macleodii]|nr:hypothetical protein RJ43_12020 [Alteromonas macleodii]
MYTRGFVGFYKTFPGKYIPSPLRIIASEYDSSIEDPCEDVLGLTKMNWSNTQLDGRTQITIEWSKNVGEIMKYINEHEKNKLVTVFICNPTNERGDYVV